MKLIKKIFDLERKKKYFILIIVDTLLFYLSYLISIYIRFDDDLSLFVIQNLSAIIIITPLSVIISLKINKFDKYIVRSYSFSSSEIILFYTLMVVAITTILSYLFYASFPRSILITSYLLFFVFVLLSRIYIFKFYKKFFFKNHKKIIIYGFSNLSMFSLDLIEKKYNIIIIAIIDNKKITSGSIFNHTEFISEKDFVNKKLNYDEIWLFNNLINKKEIEKKLKKYNKPIKYFDDIISNIILDDYSKKILETKIAGRELEVSEIIKLNFYNQKQVLITGAGGTIGSEISRQILKNKSKKILLLEQNEFALHKIYNELTNYGQTNTLKVIPILGSISDKNLLKNLLSKDVDIIVNSAAYKHVELVQKNYFSALNNNINGIINLLKSIPKNKKIKFVQISTDKAAKPMNIMGFTKFIGECLIISYSKKLPNTLFSIVRFGNVINSSGSVIPIFINQIKNGGPITVTDKRMERYLMSVSEAVKLVLSSCLLVKKKTELFVLDMGKPIKILKIAKLLIKNYSGLDYKSSNIKIKFTGIKEGEKLFEESLIDKNSVKTEFEKVYYAKIVKVNEIRLNNFIKLINKLDHSSDLKIFIQIIKKSFSKYISKDFR